MPRYFKLGGVPLAREFKETSTVPSGNLDDRRSISIS
jgi:hypothetical protein